MKLIDTNNNQAIDFLSKPFTLLDDYKSKLFLVIFCGVFSTFFIFFYNPFNLHQIKYDSAIGRLLSIWNAGILGTLILSFTQFFLRPKIKLDTFTRGQFLFWVFFEFTCLCVGIYIIFGEREADFWGEFFLIVRYTISVAFLPYFLACLLIAVKKLSEKVQKEEIPPSVSSRQHLFKDENGKIMLAINPQQILFLKSENNYTSIHYLQNDRVDKKLIRTNLKKLESELDLPYLIRIHRSYMVNLKNIVSVHRKKGGFQIQLDQLPDRLLNVSETYKNAFVAKIKR